MTAPLHTACAVIALAALVIGIEIGNRFTVALAALGLLFVALAILAELAHDRPARRRKRVARRLAHVPTQRRGRP